MDRFRIDVNGQIDWRFSTQQNSHGAIPQPLPPLLSLIIEGELEENLIRVPLRRVGLVRTGLARNLQPRE